MQTVTEIVNEIQKHAEKADVEMRVCRRCEVGTRFHQGDLYLTRVGDKHARGSLIGEGDVQIALGTGNGARHMAVGKLKVYTGKALPPGVKPMDGIDPSVITGPVIVADEPWCLQHPEHAHHQLPSGVYQTTYQFDPKTMQRVRD